MAWLWLAMLIVGCIGLVVGLVAMSLAVREDARRLDNLEQRFTIHVRNVHGIEAGGDNDVLKRVHTLEVAMAEHTHTITLPEKYGLGHMQSQVPRTAYMDPDDYDEPGAYPTP